MVGSVLSSCLLDNGLLERLFEVVARERVIWGPVPSDDGSSKLQIIDDANAIPVFSQLTRLPLKKLILPQGEAVWTCREGRYHDEDPAESLLITGIPLCDLQSLWYLDQVFAEDVHYQKRRSKIFVVGAMCEPGPDCRCDKNLMPVAGDLFLDQDRVWALSAAGEAVLKLIGADPLEEHLLPWPAAPAEKRCTIAPEQLHAKQNAEVWKTEGARCLSCGACSAVCPTCYCFDLMDVAGADGSVSRERVWDNCFFAEHGQVAGGFDFRPSRAERLRFRMEHKRLGFGELRGQDSCVGCGRCRSACPVDIDLDEIIAQFEGGQG